MDRRKIMTIGSRISVCLLFSFVFLFGVEPVHSSSGILLRIDVQEGIPGDSSSFQLIDQRDVELLNGKQTASFQANFTLSITPTIIPKDLADDNHVVAGRISLLEPAFEAGYGLLDPRRFYLRGVRFCKACLLKLAYVCREVVGADPEPLEVGAARDVYHKIARLFDVPDRIMAGA